VNLLLTEKLFCAMQLFAECGSIFRSSPGTTYGRTTEVVWKVLRDTDGERFVSREKFAVFTEELKGAFQKRSRRNILATIKTLL